MRLFTHLNFGGNCEEALRFYEQELGGSIETIFRVRDLPEGAPRPSGSPDAVIHARMSIAGVVLIGNDVPPDVFQPIRGSYLFLSVDSAEEAERIYAALAEDGQVGMKMQETFFATHFAQLRDRFGTLWTILHERAR